MRKIFSFDLDSTLCDTRHRKHIIDDYRERGEEVDWSEYAAACLQDAPTSLVPVLQVMQEVVPWVVVSGRSESSRDLTLQWLAQHGLKPTAVFLEGGRTEEHTTMGHTAFKALQVIDACATMFSQGFDMVAHFDDWPDVEEALLQMSGGEIAGVTVTPPGMRAVFPDTPDNPGEAQEVL